MKKIFLLFISLFVCVPFCRGWIVADQTAEHWEKGERTVLSWVFEGNPLPVGIVYHKRIGITEERVKEAFREAVEKWKTQTASYIYAAGREKEFKDVLTVLKRPVTVDVVYSQDIMEWQFLFEPAPWRETVRKVFSSAPKDPYPQTKATAVLLFVYGDSIYTKAIGGLADINDHLLPSIWLNHLEDPSVLQHEVGHLLGFGDIATINGYAGFLYGLSYPYPSIMWGQNDSYGELDVLSCTDADGMINSFDLIYGKARGGRKGWKTLCPGKDWRYVRSRLQNRPPYFMFTPDYSWLAFYSEDGTSDGYYSYDTGNKQGYQVPFIGSVTKKLGDAFKAEDAHGNRIVGGPFHMIKLRQDGTQASVNLSVFLPPLSADNSFAWLFWGDGRGAGVSSLQLDNTWRWNDGSSWSFSPEGVFSYHYLFNGRPMDYFIYPTDSLYVQEHGLPFTGTGVAFFFESAGGLSVAGRWGVEEWPAQYTAEMLRRDLLALVWGLPEEEVAPDVIAQTEYWVYDGVRDSYEQVISYAQPLLVPGYLIEDYSLARALDWKNGLRKAGEAVLAKQSLEPPLGIPQDFANAWWHYWTARILWELDRPSFGVLPEPEDSEEPYSDEFGFYPEPLEACVW